MLNSNINSKMHQAHKQSRYRKSNSVALLKTLPAEQIVFNPSEFYVGESKIERLPQKIITRRNSQPTLPRTEKFPSSKESKQLQHAMLKASNERLKKENQELKKQIQLYKRASRSSSQKGSLEESSRRDLKQIVVQKINRTKCSSRLASDNQTGLYSSKQISSYHSEFESINQMYQNYMKRQFKPSFLQFQEQLKKFFTEMEEASIKLKELFSTFGRAEQRLEEFGKCHGLIQKISEVCLFRIQQEKTAKNPRLGEKIKSKPKVQRQTTKEKTQQKQDFIELMSPDEAIDRLEKYILKIMGSQKMLKTLKTNLVVRRFTKKLSEV